MAMHPEVQRKAQEELDRVIGGDRLPAFEDQASLPYLNALLKEVLRWHIVTPIGLPHCTVADDMYNGYHIPAKTIVMVNIWCVDSRAVAVTSWLTSFAPVGLSLETLKHIPTQMRSSQSGF